MVTQESLEADMYANSQSRLRKDMESYSKRGEWADSKLGQRFVKSAYRKFVDAVTDFMSLDKKIGRHARAAELLKATGLEPEVIAYLFTKATFNTFGMSPNWKTGRGIKRVSLCIKAANMIHTEWRIRHFASVENRKILLDKIMKDMEKRTYPKDWKLRTIRQYFDQEQLDWSGWSQKQKLAVGYALMVLFRDTTGLIVAPKDSPVVEPAPEFVGAVRDASEYSILDFTLYWPMVAKPRPWDPDTNLFKGGYLSKTKVRSYPIIKGSRRRDVDRMLNMDWSSVIPALNAVQETPLRINRKMVEILDWVYFDLADGRCNLPEAEDVPLPHLPFNYHEDEEVRKAHNGKVFRIHDYNRQLKAKRIAVGQTLALAKKFEPFPRLYFPHNLDVRGRAYPLPAFLSPQGPDYSKALLEFANSEPIENDEQAGWLAVAGANAWGNDKVSLQDRADWVVENEWWIVECGRNPKANTRWMQADEPFMFLRFCMEWADYTEAVDNGEIFYSRMPVHVDATNSGLQHYSAMLRDPVGGRAVNLIPGLSRQDIYGDVAKATLSSLLTIPVEDENYQLASDWVQFGLDRKMTKRQVMVVPYSGKFTSCMDYTEEAYYEKLKNGHERLWVEKEDRSRLVFLSQEIWKGIDEVVIEAKAAMKWLSSVATKWSTYRNKELTEDGYDRRLSWVTPDGFEVVQWRDKSRKALLETYLEGRVQLVYYIEGDRLDGREMSLSMAPNFVHSLDACHMRMSINKALELGIHDFVMIHDSFGVHARFMPQFLQEAVKPAFIEMYRDHDPLQDLADRLPFNPGALPKKGTLDLEGIRDSEFFFS